MSNTSGGELVLKCHGICGMGAEVGPIVLRPRRLVAAPKPGALWP